MKIFRLVVVVFLMMAETALTQPGNDFTYDLGNGHTLSVNILLDKKNSKTRIQVQAQAQGLNFNLLSREFPLIPERIQLPQPSNILSFTDQGFVIFDHDEFDAHLKDQGLLPIKLEEGSQSRLLVLPVLENIQEISRNSSLTLFEFFDGIRNKNFLFRGYSFRLLTSQNMMEKNISISPQLLYTYADYNEQKNKYSYSDLKLIKTVDGLSKATNISNAYIPVDQVSKYPVSISYSSAMQDYSYHIKPPEGGKIVKNISKNTIWYNTQAYILYQNTHEGKSWGETAIVSQRPELNGFNFNFQEEPGFGSRSEELEEVLQQKRPSAKEELPKIPKGMALAKRAQGLDQINEYLSQFQKKVEEVVKGQPEAVEVLSKMELSNQSNGLEVSRPQVAWFLGMPGTGKDTLVEAYIQAKHQLIYPHQKVEVEDHIYRLPKLKDDRDLWSLTGSGTGYRGSENLSPLIRFLVKHSGGKYLIKEVESGGVKSQEVHENKNWKDGQVLEGYYSPDEAILFANEMHDWSKSMINTFLKEALEKGFYEIGNGGKGLNRIQVPVNIIMASNHGIGKIAARDSQGKRVGKPLSFEGLMERWNIAVKNVRDVFEELKSPTPGNEEGGCSEEVLSRIPKSNFVLLRPLSKEGVQAIAKFKLSKLIKSFAREKSNKFPHFKISFDKSLYEFLSTYDQMAEDGARILDDKIKNLVEKTILDAVVSGQLKVNEKEIYKVSVSQNKDGTFSLIVNSKNLSKGLNLIVKGTLKEKSNQPVTDSRIDELNDLEKKLNARVKGVSHIIKELARDVRRSENTSKEISPELNEKQADVYMFLGSSSTGKTELAVALHQSLYKDKGKPLVIDFSQVQTMADLKEKILGKKDAQGKPIPSEFMQEFDRRNGDFVVVFDEVANANPEVLKGLYEILREASVTFSDNKLRSMARVKIIATGNAGEEWYQSIPRDIPDVEQYEAARRIYESSVGNDNFKRKFLMSKFSEALINRFSLNRIYFFGPHTHETTREVIQIKLVKALESFNEPRKGVRTWKVSFASAQDYKATIEAIESYGFKIWEQGASVTQFIEKQFMNQLHDELLSRKIPEGAKVLIRKKENKAGVRGEEGTLVGFELQVENMKEPIAFNIRGKGVAKKMKVSRNNFILTAIHESGHAFLNRVLLGDKIKSAGVSIIPGVAEIEGQWIRYDGVAMSTQLESLSMTRETLIYKMAVLLGGGIAESLATKNYKLTAGHQNDLQRASKIASMMVVDFGLSEYQGPSRQEGQSMDSYMSSLGAAQKKKIEKAVDALLKEAQVLAETMLMAHFESFVMPVARSLAAKGEIKGDVINRYYDMKSFEMISSYDEASLKKAKLAYKKQITSSSEVTSAISRRDFEFHDFLKTSDFKIFDLESKLEEKFLSEVSRVDLTPGQRVIDSQPSLKETLLAKRSQNSRMCLKFYRK